MFLFFLEIFMREREREREINTITKNNIGMKEEDGDDNKEE